MQPRWIGVMWVASAAAFLGALVAALIGGVALPWWFFIALLVLPAAITLAGHLRSISRTQYRAEPLLEERSRRVGFAGARGSRTTPTSGDRETGVDWVAVNEIYRALDDREVTWLRSTEFVTPWFDSHARRAIDLAPLVADATEEPFARDLVDVLDILADAIEAFADFYDRNTVPDPLLLGGDWRFFHVDDPGAAEASDVSDDLSAERAARLHGLAVELADAYEDFAAIAALRPSVQAQTGRRVSRDPTLSL
jgi:hypothetical protein